MASAKCAGPQQGSVEMARQHVEPAFLPAVVQQSRRCGISVSINQVPSTIRGMQGTSGCTHKLQPKLPCGAVLRTLVACKRPPARAPVPRPIHIQHVRDHPLIPKLLESTAKSLKHLGTIIDNTKTDHEPINTKTPRTTNNSPKPRQYNNHHDETSTECTTHHQIT